MPIRTERILGLIKTKLSTLNLDSNLDSNFIEVKLVDNLLSAINKFNDEDVFNYEEEEELYTSNYKSDEFEPVFEHFFDHQTREIFSYEYICKVLEYKDNHPNHTMKTISTKFRRVKNAGYITKFRTYKENMGTKRSKYILIAKYCKEMFDESRANGIIIHDRTIKMWALHKARELNLNDFTASHWWINKFKMIYKISSRRIVKFITYRQQRDLEEIENEGVELLLDYEDNIKRQFDPTEIFNTDQSGFNYIVNTNRTLSYMNERITTATTNSLFPLTHSYTIQPLLNMDGQLCGKLYVNLREKDGKFG
jgi:hypothetical protein